MVKLWKTDEGWFACLFHAQNAHGLFASTLWVTCFVFVLP
jgi:hypothetical protein